MEHGLPARSVLLLLHVKVFCFFPLTFFIFHKPCSSNGYKGTYLNYKVRLFNLREPYFPFIITEQFS